MERLSTAVDIHWPHLCEAVAESKEILRPCIIISTGSFNPIHRGHIDMMASAKQTLEQSWGYRCIGGWLSPSHDSYVGSKAKAYNSFHLCANDRLRMISLAIAEAGHENWLFPSAWEATAVAGFVDFPDVAAEIKAAVASLSAHNSITIFYVCGVDHAIRCGLRLGFDSRYYPSLADVGVVIIPRSGDSVDALGISADSAEACIQESADRRVFVATARVTAELLQCSSSAVQRAIRSQDFEVARRMLGEQVFSHCMNVLDIHGWEALY